MACINISDSSFKFCIFGGPFTQTSHLQKTSINKCGRSKVSSSCMCMTYEMLQWVVLANIFTKKKPNFEQFYPESKLELTLKLKEVLHTLDTSRDQKFHQSTPLASVLDNLKCSSRICVDVKNRITSDQIPILG